MRDLWGLKGITAEDIQKLRGQGITGIDELWSRIGKDFDCGIDELARTAVIDRSHVIELLAADAECEAEKAATGELKRLWPEAFLILSVCMLFLLVLRAVGAEEFLPRPFELRGNVLLAVRDLEPGRVLRSGDLRVARASARDDYFQVIDETRGLILSRGVSRQQPLRFEDVLRLQVVATKDVLPEAIITPDEVSLTWCHYDPGATVSLDQAAGHRALQAIRAGDVILSEFIEPVSPVVK